MTPRLRDYVEAEPSVIENLCVTIVPAYDAPQEVII